MWPKISNDLQNGLPKVSYLDAREGHNIVSKIQNSAFVNYGVVRVAKKQDSRGAKCDAFGGPGCDVNDLSCLLLVGLICQRILKTFFKQFLVDTTTGITKEFGKYQC